MSVEYNTRTPAEHLILSRRRLVRGCMWTATSPIVAGWSPVLLPTSIQTSSGSTLGFRALDFTLQSKISRDSATHTDRRKALWENGVITFLSFSLDPTHLHLPLCTHLIARVVRVEALRGQYLASAKGRSEPPSATVDAVPARSSASAVKPSR